MNLYTYGSLRLPQVWEKVVGRTFLTTPGRLRDHVALRVKGRLFPGIIPRAGAVTAGTVYHDLDDDALVLLDAYESTLYERLPVVVETSGGPVDAQAYVVKPEYQIELESTPWDFQAFVEQDLAEYMAGLD